MKAIRTPSVISPWRICSPPKYQTKKAPKLIMKLVTVKNTNQLRSPTMLTPHRSSLCASKRRLSRASWLKAFTTRMPVMDSLSCAFRRDHLAPQRVQCRTIRPQMRLPESTMGGIGISTSKVSFQLVTSSRARMPTNRSELDNTNGISMTIYSSSRSESFVIREMSEPTLRLS